MLISLLFCMVISFLPKAQFFKLHSVNNVFEAVKKKLATSVLSGVELSAWHQVFDSDKILLLI